MTFLDPALLEVLVCPQCDGALEPDEAQSQLRCAHCALAYPVEDGIPIMLVDEAKPITQSTPSAA